MDKDRFNHLVDYIRWYNVDHNRELWETPAKTWAFSYKSMSVPELRDSQRAMLRTLIADSKKTKLAWDSLSLIAQEYLREGSALPPELRDWVIDVLAGKRTKPTTGAQAKSLRDTMVHLAIHHLIKRFDLSPMRNISQTIDGKKSDWPHCCPEGGSACDVVGKALGGISYKNVERIWTSRPYSKVPS